MHRCGQTKVTMKFATYQYAGYHYAGYHYNRRREAFKPRKDERKKQANNVAQPTEGAGTAGGEEITTQVRGPYCRDSCFRSYQYRWWCGHVLSVVLCVPGYQAGNNVVTN